MLSVSPLKVRGIGRMELVFHSHRVGWCECFWPDWQLGQSWGITCLDKRPHHVHTSVHIHTNWCIVFWAPSAPSGAIRELLWQCRARRRIHGRQALGAGHANLTENVRHPNNLDNGTRAHTPCPGNRMWRTHSHTHAQTVTTYNIQTLPMTHRDRYKGWQNVEKQRRQF